MKPEDRIENLKKAELLVREAARLLTDYDDGYREALTTVADAIELDLGFAGARKAETLTQEQIDELIDYLDRQ